MTIAENAPALTLWIGLSLAILSIGIITFIYSRKNWRTTLSFVGLAIVVTIYAFGFDIWDKYLHSHFVGEFDQLGIPFRKAGPGWKVMLELWPIWVMPIALTFAFIGAIFWLKNQIEPHSHQNENSKKHYFHKDETHQHISQNIELKTLKRENNTLKERLQTTIEVAEQQMDKIFEFQMQIEKLTEEKDQGVNDSEDKADELMLQYEKLLAENKSLNTLIQQQTEEIDRLSNP